MVASVTSGVASGVGVASEVGVASALAEGDASSGVERSTEGEVSGSAEDADWDGLGVTGASDSWRGPSLVADTEGSTELSSRTATEGLAPEKLEKSSAALNSAAIAVR